MNSCHVHFQGIPPGETAITNRAIIRLFHSCKTSFLPWALRTRFGFFFIQQIQRFEKIRQIYLIFGVCWWRHVNWTKADKQLRENRQDSSSYNDLWMGLKYLNLQKYPFKSTNPSKFLLWKCLATLNKAKSFGNGTKLLPIKSCSGL